MTLREFLTEWWVWLTTTTWLKIQAIQAAPLDVPASFYGDVLGAAAIWLGATWLVMLIVWQMWNEWKGERELRRWSSHSVDEPAGHTICHVCYRRGCTKHEAKP